MDVVLGSPRGFCAGVVRAIDIVERALQKFGSPIYVRHEIVHNPHVVDRLRGMGAIFVDELSQIPDNQRVIFSAHGVPPQIWSEARGRGLQIIDGTCPLVTKVHNEALKYSREGATVVLVGHRDHPEVIGTAGEVPGGAIIVETVEEAESIKISNAETVAALTQTTLSVEDTREILKVLEDRFPSLTIRNDICYATSNRQQATKALAQEVDLVLVIGARNSSNCNRLREVAENSGVPAYLVNTPQEIDTIPMNNVFKVGIISGASTPEDLVQAVVARLSPEKVLEHQVVPEDVQFVLPQELR
jgi:4-hydroxy-3-methylbut-2-enyl diphosphate reductase